MGDPRINLSLSLTASIFFDVLRGRDIVLTGASLTTLAGGRKTETMFYMNKNILIQIEHSENILI